MRAGAAAQPARADPQPADMTGGIGEPDAGVVTLAAGQPRDLDRKLGCGQPGAVLGERTPAGAALDVGQDRAGGGVGVAVRARGVGHAHGLGQAVQQRAMREQVRLGHGIRVSAPLLLYRPPGGPSEATYIWRTTGSPAARHARKPPITSVAAAIPNERAVAAARLDW